MAQATHKITVSDPIHKARSSSTEIEHPYKGTIGPSSALAGGIYNSRSFSRATSGRRSLSRASRNRNRDAPDAEEGDEWIRDDGHKKQVFHGWNLIWYIGTLLALDTYPTPRRIC